MGTVQSTSFKGGKETNKLYYKLQLQIILFILLSEVVCFWELLPSVLL